jgi:hypothetical protein
MIVSEDHSHIVLDTNYAHLLHLEPSFLYSGSNHFFLPHNELIR